MDCEKELFSEFETHKKKKLFFFLDPYHIVFQNCHVSHDGLSVQVWHWELVSSFFSRHFDQI
jgi:hypothetical protein